MAYSTENFKITTGRTGSYITHLYKRITYVRTHALIVILIKSSLRRIVLFSNEIIYLCSMRLYVIV